MHSSKRRKLLAVLASSFAASAVSFASTARALECTGSEAQAQPASAAEKSAHENAGADILLLERAGKWTNGLRSRGQKIVPYPVSRLQREFRIGYNRTCALAETLAQQREWTIAYMNDGTRYARIHPKVAG